MKSEMSGMKEGESKYGWYAKMYVKMLLGLLSLPFMFLIMVIAIEEINYKIWELRGQPCPDCRYKLKDVRLSGYTMEGLNFKRCPNCGCVMEM
ncbi:unnamed protein product [marine sediment metagenome]|uniref:Uncharacterized protein n=1 Tax=marine sediment metagenome TaxID=412755 RepID=X1N3W8_9ZZZZ